MNLKKRLEVFIINMSGILFMFLINLLAFKYLWVTNDFFLSLNKHNTSHSIELMSCFI